MEDERGNAESAALLAVLVGLVLAALFYTVAIVVAILVKLLLWSLLLAAIGVPIYFLIKQQKEDKGAGQGIDADLLEMLARVENLEPVGWTTNTAHWSSGRDEGCNYPGLFSGEIQKDCDYEYQE